MQGCRLRHPRRARVSLPIRAFAVQFDKPFAGYQPGLSLRVTDERAIAGNSPVFIRSTPADIADRRIMLRTAVASRSGSTGLDTTGPIEASFELYSCSR